MLFLNMVRKIF